jgi:CO dehydrogenase/acetyl-CoA synthase beta subunit
MSDLREKIARAMCKTADDDWSLGRYFWLDRSDAILALVREDVARLMSCGCANAEAVTKVPPNSAVRWHLCGEVNCMAIEAAAILAAFGEEPTT